MGGLLKRNKQGEIIDPEFISLLTFFDSARLGKWGYGEAIEATAHKNAMRARLREHGIEVTDFTEKRYPRTDRSAGFLGKAEITQMPPVRTDAEMGQGHGMAGSPSEARGVPGVIARLDNAIVRLYDKIQKVEAEGGDTTKLTESLKTAIAASEGLNDITKKVRTAVAKEKHATQKGKILLKDPDVEPTKATVHEENQRTKKVEAGEKSMEKFIGWLEGAEKILGKTLPDNLRALITFYRNPTKEKEQKVIEKAVEAKKIPAEPQHTPTKPPPEGWSLGEGVVSFKFRVEHHVVRIERKGKNGETIIDENVDIDKLLGSPKFKPSMLKNITSLHLSRKYLRVGKHRKLLRTLFDMREADERAERLRKATLATIEDNIYEE
jgi:hypothetical protein